MQAIERKAAMYNFIFEYLKYEKWKNKLLKKIISFYAQEETQLARISFNSTYISIVFKVQFGN